MSADGDTDLNNCGTSCNVLYSCRYYLGRFFELSVIVFTLSFYMNLLHLEFLSQKSSSRRHSSAKHLFPFLKCNLYDQSWSETQVSLGLNFLFSYYDNNNKCRSEIKNSIFKEIVIFL